MKSGRLLCWPDLDQLCSEAAMWQGQACPLERAEALRAAMAEWLTPRQREALELHYFEGLTERAAAERLGISQQVLHRSIHGVDRGGRRIGGALARLREALGGAPP
jgi:DNA-directed RNA polymerase specialized sigma24 family protein